MSSNSHRPQLWPEMTNLKNVLTATISNISNYSGDNNQFDEHDSSFHAPPEPPKDYTVVAGGPLELSPRGRLFSGSFGRMDDIAEDHEVEEDEVEGTEETIMMS